MLSDFIILVKELGFPIAAFAISISALIFMIKKNEKRQELSDKRYEDLVNKFIQTTKEISTQHENAMTKLSDTLNERMEDVTSCIKKLEKGCNNGSKVEKINNNSKK